MDMPLLSQWIKFVDSELQDYVLELENYNSKIFDRLLLERDRNELTDEQNIQLCKVDQRFIELTHKTVSPVLVPNGQMDWILFRVPKKVESKLFNKDIEKLHKAH